MTIFARDLNTGMAKWVYQMTPHDDGTMTASTRCLLIDVKMKGQTVPAGGALRP